MHIFARFYAIKDWQSKRKNAEQMPSNSNQTVGSYTSRALILIQDLALALVSSLLSVLLVRWLSEPVPHFTNIVLRWLLVSFAGMLAGLLVTRMMNVVTRYVTVRSSLRLVWAALIRVVIQVTVLISGWVSFPSTVYSVMVILSDFVLTMTLLLVVRFFVSEVTRENARVAAEAAKGTALIAGTGESSVELADRTDNEGRYTVVGFFSPNRSLDGLVIGNRIVYYCSTAQDLEKLQWRLGGVDAILFPKASDEILLEGEPSVDISVEIPQSDGMTLSGHAIKRIFDLVLSAVLLVVFAPIMAICAIAIRLEDGKPVLFRQERVGRGGRVFNILKFRSMRVDAEAGGPALYDGDNDPRLTKVGRFLRNHHLDELPQLWNVFRGDMSFIGYRPERKYYIDQIMEQNPRYRYLYQIRPGVTSYATLYNGYTDTLEKMLTRLDLDLYYLRNHAVWFDLKVLGLTFLSIVSGRKF